MSVTQFSVRTSHRTYLSVDPATGTLRHAPDGPDGNRVLAHWFGEDSCVLTRRDGGPLSVAIDGADLTAPLLPCRLVTDADRSRVALRHVAGPLVTALPGGGVMHDRTLVADWELFTLEPDGGARPAISAAFDSDDAFQSFCFDPTHDPGSIAGLLALLPTARRRAILPSLVSRADYPDIFAALRRLLSGGRDRYAWHARTHLHHGIEAYGWVVGDHSYGNPQIVDPEQGHLEIGRYCSIAGDVRIIISNHSVDTVTTYPFAALHRFWPSAPDDSSDHDALGVVIGSSVWIGQGAIILPGSRIGDGAIIGAGAVVSRRIPPYAVAVGNPARVKRVRFDKSVVDRLLAVRWWDWPDELVDRHVPLLLGGDVERFLQVAEAAPLALDSPPVGS